MQLLMPKHLLLNGSAKCCLHPRRQREIEGAVLLCPAWLTAICSASCWRLQRKLSLQAGRTNLRRLHEVALLFFEKMVWQILPAANLPLLPESCWRQIQTVMWREDPQLAHQTHCCCCERFACCACFEACQRSEEACDCA